MRLAYICSQCGADVDELFVQELNERALGFDCLTDVERQDLLTFDPQNNTLTVKTLCDSCIAEMQLESADESIAKMHWLH